MKKTLLTAALVLAAGQLSLASAASTFRIGYQKGGLLSVLKARGTLEQAAKAQGINIEWTLFAAGLPLLEAQNAGAIDFGSVGNAPGVFAIDGGADLRWVAVTESAGGAGEAFIVPAGSAIKSVKDLKGKKVALFRGSSAHTFFLHALEQAGLKPDDVEIVPLLPAEARPAFESGSVDAWVIWDPYLSIALKTSSARVIQDESGINRALRNSYYLSPSAAIKDPEKQKALKLTLKVLQDTATWANANPQTVIKQYSEELGIPGDIVKLSVQHGLPFNIRSFTAADLKPLQGVLDTFLAAGAIPNPLKLSAKNYATIPLEVASGARP